MVEVSKTLDQIRSLSAEKDGHVTRLTKENNEQLSLIDQLTEERDTYIEDNQAVLEVLMEQRVQNRSLVDLRDGGANVKSAVEQLIGERETQDSAVEELENDKKRLLLENEVNEKNLLTHQKK